MKYILTISTAIMVWCSVLAQNSFDTVSIRPVKVTDQIYMLKGSGRKHRCYDREGRHAYD